MSDNAPENMRMIRLLADGIPLHKLPAMRAGESRTDASWPAVMAPGAVSARLDSLARGRSALIEVIVPLEEPT